MVFLIFGNFLNYFIEERNKELDLLENGIYPPADIPKLKLQASLTFPEDSKMKQVISKDLEESSKV